MYNMNKTLKNLIITVLGIVIIVILARYFKDKIIVSLGGYTTKTTKTITKKVLIKGKVDTLAVFNHYVKTQGINLNPKAKIVYVTSPVKDKDGVVGVKVDSLKKFKVQIKDTLIEGTFTIYNKFNGDLSTSSFKYKPFFPKYLTRVDTLKITNTITETLTRDRSLFGIGAGYNSLQYLSLQGSYTTKSKWQFLYSYGKSFEKTKIIINGGVPFSFNSDDLHSFSIIKHF